MKNARFFFLGILLSWLFPGCEKEDTAIGSYSIHQKILFQYEYINYAWGKQHEGWLIESSGDVYSYHMPHNWNFCNESGSITEADMDENLAATDSICYRIDKTELISMYDLIEGASEGPVTEPEHRMCDAGVVIFSAYQYDPLLKIYKVVTIQQIGDFFIDNKSPEAEIIFQWLKIIQKDISHLK